MAMPKIPKTVYSEHVRHRPVTQWAQGPGAGGRQPTYGPFGPPLICAIKAAPVARSMDDTRLHRESAVVGYTITMDDGNKPKGLKLRDQFVWTELNKTLTVLAVAPGGDATGRTWNIFAEEHGTT